MHLTFEQWSFPSTQLLLAICETKLLCVIEQPELGAEAFLCCRACD